MMLNWRKHNLGRVFVDFPWVCQRGGKMKAKGCYHKIKSSSVTKQANHPHPPLLQLPEEISIAVETRQRKVQLATE